MTQNNLYMEDDNMRLYVDVQPLFIDELENSKNSAAASAASAAQSEANARTWKNDIIDYKTSLELFYAQARDGITNSYNNSVSDLTSVRNLAYDDLNSQKNSIRTSLNNSLNSALTSISTNGQNYVNQAREYAEQAQNTVDNRVSKDLLIQSNAFKAGSVSTNMDVLAEVNNYAHSTFDLSKFTVVGSPNITDDGIASGFSASNYLTLNTLDLTKPFKITLRFTVGAVASTSEMLVGNTNSVALKLEASNFKFYYNNSYYVGFTVTSNTTYDIIAEYDGNTTIKLHYKTFGQNEYSVQQSTSVVQSSNTAYQLYISKWWTTPAQPWLGSIDLKQFSITVDGVEVFSGNKTGIDTIKPDDYTEVGTVTFTPDGIASGFTTGNYLTKDLGSISNCTDFEFLSPIYTFTSDMTGSELGLFGSYRGGNQYDIHSWYIANSHQMVVLIYDGSTQIQRCWYSVPANCTMQIKMTYKNGVWSTYHKINNGNFTLSSAIVGTNPIEYSTPVTFSSDYPLAIGAETYNGMFPLGGIAKVDLNACKVFTYGDLVYQPCLKIPFTASKTGSKIVDSVYRSRVNDMASQFGFAPYYTLGENDFTLPQVELYGLIGQKTLRDSYENGINKWYLYSNRDLEQQGSCTSGVEVTLAKPFADTNYVLSVPYSAKSTTAFTPTQTGDWFAKGKGVL